MNWSKVHSISALLIAATALTAVAVLAIGCSNGCSAGFSFPSAAERFSTKVTDFFGIDIAAQTPDQANVLVIGVDSRKGADQMHCDAIHLVSIDTERDRVEFINVPRGTYTYIPRPDNWVPSDELIQAAYGQLRAPQEEEEGDVDRISTPDDASEDTEAPREVTTRDVYARAWQMEQYISNLCEYVGLEAFIDRVEQVTGEEVDYHVLVGFSQAQGVLRALKFDATTTLQFLRHRKSYGLGDVQRSYNQSLFLEDLLVDRTDLVADLPKTAQFALYQLVDTDLPYPVARGLLEWASVSVVRTDTSRITHRTAPKGTPRAQDIRFDEDEAQEQIDALYARLRAYDPSFSVTDVQPTLVAYVRQELTSVQDALVAAELQTARTQLQPLINQQIWLQVEDGETRQQLMVWVALLESSLTWYETYNEARALEQATTFIWNLQLEDDGAEAIARIQAHLTELMRGRVDE